MIALVRPSGLLMVGLAVWLLVAPGGAASSAPSVTGNRIATCGAVVLLEITVWPVEPVLEEDASDNSIADTICVNIKEESP